METLLAEIEKTQPAQKLQTASWGKGGGWALQVDAPGVHFLAALPQ